MKTPAVHTAMSVATSCASAEYRPGKWTPARPLSIAGPFTRLKLAWRVLIGRYDALDWEDGK